ncbi:MAG: hypothetical protein FJ247_11150 [Nitrospira sp.]|nr:hypothetical protein [Nitrospira sp.]
MVTAKSPLAQHTFEVMVVFLVLGSLSTIWPAIMGLIIGLFLLLQSFGAEQQITVLTGADISHAPIIFTSLRQSVATAFLS